MAEFRSSHSNVMRIMRVVFSAVVLIVVMCSFKSDKTKTIFMIGDSTMANKDITGGKQERGWGMMLKNFFDDGIIVDNHAQNGRSSKSFIDEGRWDKVLSLLTPGDYVIIQFGHNDEKKDEKRHTDPGSTFDDNLRRFVRETRERGGKPILLNSVVRRNFSGSQTAVADDDLRDNSSKNLMDGDTLIDTHGEYIVSPRRVASEMNVPFVDANKITHDLEQGLGNEASKKLHMWFKPGETPSLPKGRQDNTHYSIYGGNIVASLISDAIVEAVPALRKHHVKYDIYVSKDGSGQFFNLQDAINSVPSDKKRHTISISGGTWTKPSVPKNKKVKFELRRGAQFK